MEAGKEPFGETAEFESDELISFLKCQRNGKDAYGQTKSEVHDDQSGVQRGPSTYRLNGTNPLSVQAGRLKLKKYRCS